MTKDEALKLALEALTHLQPNALTSFYTIGDRNKAITAIREALVQQEVVLPGGGHTPAIPVAVYGYCPECGGAGVMRERKPGGDDKCTNGHKYPSSKALAQPEQEPVASGEPLPCPFCGHTGLDFSDGSTYRWGHASCGGCGAKCGEVRREYPDKGEWHSEAIAEWNRRYTRPQARESLSDEVIDYLWRVATTKPGLTLPMVRGFARAIEAAHGIKGEA